MKENFLLSVVVPMYYEEEVAEECYNRLTSVMLKTTLNMSLFLLMMEVLTKLQKS